MSTPESIGPKAALVFMSSRLLMGAFLRLRLLTLNVALHRSVSSGGCPADFHGGAERGSEQHAVKRLPCEGYPLTEQERPPKRWVRHPEGAAMFPLRDDVPSRRLPAVMWALV